MVEEADNEGHAESLYQSFSRPRGGSNLDRVAVQSRTLQARRAAGSDATHGRASWRANHRTGEVCLEDAA